MLKKVAIFKYTQGHFNTIQGLDRVICLMDNILFLEKNNGMNFDKFFNDYTAEEHYLGRALVKFPGHLVDKNGMRAKPEKTAAFFQM